LFFSLIPSSSSAYHVIGLGRQDPLDEVSTLGRTGGLPTSKFSTSYGRPLRYRITDGWRHPTSDVASSSLILTGKAVSQPTLWRRLQVRRPRSQPRAPRLGALNAPLYPTQASRATPTLVVRANAWRDAGPRGCECTWSCHLRREGERKYALEPPAPLRGGQTGGAPGRTRIEAPVTEDFKGQQWRRAGLNKTSFR